MSHPFFWLIPSLNLKLVNEAFSSFQYWHKNHEQHASCACVVARKRKATSKSCSRLCFVNNKVPSLPVGSTEKIIWGSKHENRKDKKRSWRKRKKGKHKEREKWGKTGIWFVFLINFTLLEISIVLTFLEKSLPLIAHWNLLSLSTFPLKPIFCSLCINMSIFFFPIEFSTEFFTFLVQRPLSLHFSIEIFTFFLLLNLQ